MCVHACVRNTGYLNMQLLFSESSLCDQLSDGGPSLAEQIPGKVLGGNKSCQNLGGLKRHSEVGDLVLLPVTSESMCSL